MEIYRFSGDRYPLIFNQNRTTDVNPWFDSCWESVDFRFIYWFVFREAESLAFFFTLDNFCAKSSLLKGYAPMFLFINPCNQVRCNKGSIRNGGFSSTAKCSRVFWFGRTSCIVTNRRNKGRNRLDVRSLRLESVSEEVLALIVASDSDGVGRQWKQDFQRMNRIGFEERRNLVEDWRGEEGSLARARRCR